MATRNRLLTDDFHSNVKFGDLFYTFMNSSDLDEMFFEKVLEKGTKKRGYKAVIETIEKQSSFIGPWEYRKLFDKTSKDLVQNLIKRINFVYGLN